MSGCGTIEMFITIGFASSIKNSFIASFLFKIYNFNGKNIYKIEEL
jgi:hypothetical protein